jgi:flagellar biosynthesis/type III secretory pathway protein FliH
MSERLQSQQQARSQRWVAVAAPEPLPGLSEPEAPWWFDDDFYPGDESDEAAFIAGMPEDVRAAYLSGAPDGDTPPPGDHPGEQNDQPEAEFSPSEWDACVPGRQLGRALEAQNGRFGELNDPDLIAALEASHRQVCHAQAQRAKIVSALARRREEQGRQDGDRHPGEFTGEEIAVALHLTAWSAGTLLRQADGLDRFGALMRSLDAGHVDYPKANILTEGLAGMSDEIASQIVDDLLGDAETMTTAQLREALRAAILAADPEAAERRRKDARHDARVEMWDEVSGNKAIAARELSPADAIVIDTQVTAHAEYLQSLGAPGSISELRSAVHNGLLSGRDPATLIPGWDPPLPETDSDLPEPAVPASYGPHGDGYRTDDEHGTQHEYGAHDGPGFGSGAGVYETGRVGAGWPRLSGTIHLTMPLSAFDGISQRPGEAATYGPLDAGTCRDLGAQMSGAVTRWCLTLTDSRCRAVAHTCTRAGPAPGQTLKWAAGLKGKMQYLEAGTCGHARESPRYRPPDSLAHLIRVRQRTCAAPGCRRPARKSDLDHTIPYREGGRTCECDLAPLCRRHHRCKHASRWRLDQHKPGHMTWTLPHERIYETEGQPFPV